MKIRKGFVSNSSSTSFLIVGVAKYGDPRLATLAIADSWKECGQGWNEGKTLVFLGDDWAWDDNDEPANYKPYYVGINAEPGLRKNKTVQELKREFIARARALNVIFQENEVDLYYGEVSSE